MKGVKQFLTAGLLAAVFVAAGVAGGTSLREFENMTKDQQTVLLVREANELLGKVKDYDPALEQKTRTFMFVETNKSGFVKGMGEVVGTIGYAVEHRPETLDQGRVETLIKVVFRRFWKEQGIAVPTNVFRETVQTLPTSQATTNAVGKAVKP